jgi:nucleoside-diphosphate-sugar epimerase
MLGGISDFHTYAYDLRATNERIVAASCDAAIRAFSEGTLEKVTYMSSSMVFESATSWPSYEGQEREIPPPLSSYGFQKLAVEYFARAAWEQHGLPYTIVRPFNCVGVGEGRALGDVEVLSGNVKLAMSHVVPDLVQKVLKGQDPLHILGDGTQIRHYTYGGDLARGIVSAMEHPDARNEDFNLSTSRSTTVLELAELIWRKVKDEETPFRYVSDPPFEHDVQRRVPATDKARRVLDFEASTTLDEMLDEVIPWVEQALADGRI